MDRIPALGHVLLPETPGTPEVGHGPERGMDRMPASASRVTGSRTCPGEGVGEKTDPCKESSTCPTLTMSYFPVPWK